MSSCADSCLVDEHPPPPVSGAAGDAGTAKEEYDFIEQPSQEYFCPVTFELLLHPDQTSCCGHHISREVVVRIQKDKKPCPMCKEPLTTVPDKFFRRKVRELKVWCSHKKNGCEWVGDLGSYDDHVIKCPKRPWQCEFCDFKSTYDIGNEHLPNCEKRPIPCPNACEIGTVPLADVESHLLECPLQLVACELAHAGCNAQVTRRELPQHMKESVQQHLLSASLLNLQLTRDKIDHLEKELKKKDEQLALKEKERDLLCTEMAKEKNDLLVLNKKMNDTFEQILVEKDRQLTDLQKRIDCGVKSLHQKFEKHVQSTEVHFITQDANMRYVHLFLGFWNHEFTLTEFEKKIETLTANLPEGDSILSRVARLFPAKFNWCGKKFYSRPGAYCFKLNIDIHRNGDTSAYLCLEKGDNDDRLPWPVEVEVHLLLLNQLGDHTHHSVTRKCVFKRGDRPKSISDSFLSYSELQHNAAENTQYLKDDCLKLRLYIKAIAKT